MSVGKPVGPDSQGLFIVTLSGSEGPKVLTREHSLLNIARPCD